MKEDIKQYNSIAEDFKNIFGVMNAGSITEFKKSLSLVMKATGTMIDFGCGTGDVIEHCKALGWNGCGVDSSVEMVVLAQQNTKADIRCEDFANTSFESNSFDLVTSKYAMQTSADIAPIYDEAARLLKKDGHFVFLVGHPLRQFLEKKRQGKDYYKKEIVESIIFDGAMTVYEPTHTLTEYLGKDFTNHFNLIDLVERSDFPSSEQIGGDIYPTYLIITAQKK